MTESTSESALRLLECEKEDNVTIEHLLACLESTLISDQAVGYEVATGISGKKVITNNKLAKKSRVLCLKYLLSCIQRDVAPSENSDILSCGEAAMELTVVFYGFPKTQDEEAIEYVLWNELSNFLSDVFPTFYDCIVTHFMEGIGNDRLFRSVISDWAEKDKLKRYVLEAKKIGIGGR